MIKNFKEHNEWNSNLFIRISISEWFEIVDHQLLDMDENGILMLEKIISKISKESDKIKFDFLKKIIFFETWVIKFEIHHRFRHVSLAHLIKVEDNYFILKLARLGENDRYFKCDDWIGVEECIKSKCL